MQKAYKHLTYEQRCQIYALKQQDFSQTLIAEAIGVEQCTISREFSRNSGKRGYRFKQDTDFGLATQLRFSRALAAPKK